MVTKIEDITLEEHLSSENSLVDYQRDIMEAADSLTDDLIAFETKNNISASVRARNKCKLVIARAKRLYTLIQEIKSPPGKAKKK